MTHSSLAATAPRAARVLGDRVLGLVSALLYQRFAGSRGAIVGRHNAIGRARNLRGSAATGLPRSRLGSRRARDGASERHVSERPSRADGALLIDGGSTRPAPCPARGSRTRGQGAAPVHAKSAMQELAAARAQDPPYRNSDARCQHAPIHSPSVVARR